MVSFSPKKLLKKGKKAVKKLLKSDAVKVAALLGAYQYGPGLWGGEKGLAGWQQGWKKGLPYILGTESTGAPVPTGGKPGIWGGLKAGWANMGTGAKAAAIGIGTGAAAGIADVPDDPDIPDLPDTGHKDYLTSRKMYLDEWTQWLIDQGEDPATARAQAERAMFSSAEGGVIGSRRRYFSGAYGEGAGDRGGDPRASREQNVREGRAPERQHRERPDVLSTPVSQPAFVPDRRNIVQKGIDKVTDFTRKNIYDPTPFNLGERQKWMNKNKDLLRAKGLYLPGEEDDYYEDRWYGQLNDEDFISSREGLEYLKGLGYQGGYHDVNNPNSPNYQPPTGGGGGDQSQYWLNQATGAAPTDTTGDYYGFKEWEDWEGGPTTPMFGGTQYKQLLNEGGRVGAQAGMYAGNPMMNRGIGNQMNQMRGNPMGMMNQQRGALVGPSALSQNQGLMATQQGNQMRGDPRMMAQLTQRPRTTGIPKENEDDELIMLIKQLIAMGYEMEQLRGRTKEELVQMMVAASGPVDKGEGEVVEEEEVMTAAGGGRIGYAEGSDDNDLLTKIARALFRLTPIGMGGLAAEQAIKMYQNLDPDTQDKVQVIGKRLAMSTPPGMAMGLASKAYDMYQDRAGDELVEEDEVIEERMNQGGITRTGYALGQPVIPSKDGMQLDMRDTGGYQPHGAQEKKDDVRALLVKSARKKCMI